MIYLGYNQPYNDARCLTRDQVIIRNYMSAVYGVTSDVRVCRLALIVLST